MTLGAARLSDAADLDVFAHALTELGNAERLVALHGSDLRFCVSWRSWLVWDGRRWERDVTREVMRRAKATIRAFLTAACAVADTERQKVAVKWPMRSQQAHALANMVELAASEPGVPVLPHALDADPWLLNVANGTLDLRSGMLRKHDRADLLTKLAPVDYDPEARFDPWDRFLAETTGNDQELRDFLQRAVGYTLVGVPDEEVFFFVFGGPASGKSTFLDAVRATLGDYAVTADFETFLTKRGDPGIRNDIARLAGARCVTSIEVEEGKRLAQGLIKQLTGGDTVTARFLYGEHFEFNPQFTLWLAANHAPKVNASDGALWRRVRRVPFAHEVPGERQDRSVKATLTNPDIAGAAILAWAVEGLRHWQAEGRLRAPAVVEASTRAYRTENDLLQPFIDECCVLDPDAWAASHALWQAYQTWTKEGGERFPLSRLEFLKHLGERGCAADRRYVGRKAARGWAGIRLRSEADEPLGHERGEGG
jgi:putative DNA primase/helicase